MNHQQNNYKMQAGNFEVVIHLDFLLPYYLTFNKNTNLYNLIKRKFTSSMATKISWYQITLLVLGFNK